MIFDLRGDARKSKLLRRFVKKFDKTRRRRRNFQENRPLTDFPERLVLRVSAVNGRFFKSWGITWIKIT